MKNKIIIFIFYFNSLFVMQTNAQAIGPLYEEVKIKFNDTFGSHFKMGGFFIVDSNIGKSSRDILFRRYKCEDTYNTLAHSVIFSGRGIYKQGNQRSPGFFGVYKGDSFIWQSDTLIDDNLIGSPNVLVTTDLNNDGKIEIVTDWLTGNGGIQYLWIVSWDGHSGTFINDTELPLEGSYKSVIIGETGSFEFVDINGDGIKEIISDSYVAGSDSLQQVVYRWNGSTYGKHGSLDFPSGNFTVSHNKLNATIKARVINTGLDYDYQYTLTNGTASAQDIEGLFVVCRTDSVKNDGSTNPWLFFGVERSLAEWQVPSLTRGFIQPGKSDSNFVFSSASLPTIGASYIRGRTANLLPINLDHNDDYYRDVMNNSFVTVTIGPSDPPNPFVPINFLDTLTSYTTQSLSLGWITTQTIANKYINYFSTAKTQLQSNNTSGARTTLQQVLTDVNIDSTSTPATQTAGKLTSEAYALLRFNTEYLISKLPGNEHKGRKKK